MVNNSLASPTLYNGTFDYDVDLEPTITDLDILAPGDLEVIDIYGNTANYTFGGAPASDTVGGDAVTSFPYRLSLQIKRIVGDGSGGVGSGGGSGTDIALTNMIPLTR